MPPARRFASSRAWTRGSTRTKILGLGVGDAHVLRNAGAIVNDDVLRSLVISRWMQDTEEIFVIGHTGCGMVGFTNDTLRAKLREETGADASEIDFEPFPDIEESVRASVARIAESPFLRESPRAAGSTTSSTGALREVV